MKRILSLILSIIMILSLCACGNKEKAEKYCSSCGEGVSKNAVFCEFCGAALNNIENGKEDVSSESIASIACPKFIGMTEEQVKQSEYNKIFNIVFEYENNNEYAINEICNQSEKEGKKLKKDATITLTVSMGITTCTVPDVLGKSESYAISQLKAEKFTYVIRETFDDEIEKGLVVRTEPAINTVVAEGTEITVYISKGKTN